MKSILIVLLSAVFIYGCSGDHKFITLEAGLKYFDNNTGTGEAAKNGDLIEINFQGWLIKDSSNLGDDWSVDTTKNINMFANSYVMGEPVKFILGSDSFIKGSEEGMVGMMPGGKRTIIIPSKLAYGENGMGPIPPNTNLKVVVELLSAREVPAVKMWDVDSTLLKTTKSGLKYAILTEGTGENVKSNETVVVHYSGFLLDGTKFDSSVERDEPITFVAGVGQVIPGWDEGLLLLKKGSKARFVIPPDLAYGERNIGKIPPNSTLIFDVELIDILSPQGQQ
ncbi:MAG TPA: FKBP-type peptidyl-prolyl cis-trans isomerase [Ignavibacteriaceae bacterium]|nr:FKBP-type peptidyl-prolyl cis-trans isomerase [Ignavibacteriaceae bacterium]